jgi:ABC-type branched-subunit amino acid transport system ATPase component
MTALLETRGVWQRFGGLVANSDVSISVGRGEIVGLIGPNGAGKSTLFNLIAGVRPPTQGTIWLDGEDITATPATERCRRGIGRTFQVVKSFETMTVIDNVIVGARSVEGDAAAARTHRTSDGFQQGGFARAVGARDTNDFALGDVDGDVGDRDKSLIGGGQITRRQHGDPPGMRQ